jgi:hypothetical protein
MAEFPWQSHSSTAPERDYVALLSYLPLKSGWSIPAKGCRDRGTAACSGILYRGEESLATRVDELVARIAKGRLWGHDLPLSWIETNDH